MTGQRHKQNDDFLESQPFDFGQDVFFQSWGDTQDGSLPSSATTQHPPLNLPSISPQLPHSNSAMHMINTPGSGLNNGFQSHTSPLTDAVRSQTALPQQQLPYSSFRSGSAQLPSHTGVDPTRSAFQGFDASLNQSARMNQLIGHQTPESTSLNMQQDLFWNGLNTQPHAASQQVPAIGRPGRYISGSEMQDMLQTPQAARRNAEIVTNLRDQCLSPNNVGGFGVPYVMSNKANGKSVQTVPQHMNSLGYMPSSEMQQRIRLGTMPYTTNIPENTLASSQGCHNSAPLGTPGMSQNFLAGQGASSQVQDTTTAFPAPVSYGEANGGEWNTFIDPSLLRAGNLYRSPNLSQSFNIPGLPQQGQSISPKIFSGHSDSTIPDNEADYLVDTFNGGSNEYSDRPHESFLSSTLNNQPTAMESNHTQPHNVGLDLQYFNPSSSLGIPMQDRATRITSPAFHGFSSSPGTSNMPYMNPNILNYYPSWPGTASNTDNQSMTSNGRAQHHLQPQILAGRMVHDNRSNTDAGTIPNQTAVQNNIANVNSDSGKRHWVNENVNFNSYGSQLNKKQNGCPPLDNVVWPRVFLHEHELESGVDRTQQQNSVFPQQQQQQQRKHSHTGHSQPNSAQRAEPLKSAGNSKLATGKPTPRAKTQNKMQSNRVEKTKRAPRKGKQPTTSARFVKPTSKNAIAGFYENDTANEIMAELQEHRTSNNATLEVDGSFRVNTTAMNASQVVADGKQSRMGAPVEQNISGCTKGLESTSVAPRSNAKQPISDSEMTQDNMGGSGQSTELGLEMAPGNLPPQSSYYPGMDPSKPDYNPFLVDTSQLNTHAQRQEAFERVLLAAFARNPTVMPSATFVPSRMNELAWHPRAYEWQLQQQRYQQYGPQHVQAIIHNPIEATASVDDDIEEIPGFPATTQSRLQESRSHRIMASNINMMGNTEAVQNPMPLSAQPMFTELAPDDVASHDNEANSMERTVVEQHGYSPSATIPGAIATPDGNEPNINNNYLASFESTEQAQIQNSEDANNDGPKSPLQCAVPQPAATNVSCQDLMHADDHMVGDVNGGGGDLHQDDTDDDAHRAPPADDSYIQFTEGNVTVKVNPDMDWGTGSDQGDMQELLGDLFVPDEPNEIDPSFTQNPENFEITDSDLELAGWDDLKARPPPNEDDFNA